MYSYKTKGTCSYEIQFDIVDGKLHNVKFFGGCPGNLSGICKIVEGMDALYVAEVFANNKCGGKSTSCPDQLSRAIKEKINEI